MQKNLVIVESPAKAKTIEKFLGKDFKVLSSYGHIRDLKKKEIKIDSENFEAEYEIPADKAKLVQNLQDEAQKAETVWLASDEDREGEAISWHLSEVLHLAPEHTKRIVFHEITKSAILKAIETPRDIDINLVNAQQARRVLDRVVGFNLSPVLWKKVKPSLSAGRVQSVTVRLIVEREREIQDFHTEASYRLTAIFQVADENGKPADVKAELNSRFKTKEEAENFLKRCQEATFTITDVTVRPLKKSPAAPFTTSTLQQEAARKLGFSVSQTMMVAQRLYESGRITYMRTDSVNLSSLAIGTSRTAIEELMGAEYVKTRQFATKAKGAQEAHEAIRPTYMDKPSIDGTAQEKRLYDLIWKRTIASQMADAEVEKTTATIAISGVEQVFVASGEVITFDGFLRVYRESYDDDVEQEDESHLLPPMKKGDELQYKEIAATQRFTQHPPRYTEASLVRKLEELGIGRPSTYAPTISTIQQRQYVEKGDKPGVERSYDVLTLKDKEISEEVRTELTDSEKGKLLPTDIGIVVNDFLLENFPEIMDYNFTANIEKEFDEVAEGEKKWTLLMKEFYDQFIPMVEDTMNAQQEHKVGERVLGIDPASGKPLSVKIGRFGPVAQIGSVDDEEKPRFAQMKKGQSISTITLEEALDLFKLPREIGQYEEKTVTIGTGRFGPYIRHNSKFISLPKEYDPLTISLEESIVLIEKKRVAEAQKHIKQFEEDTEMEVLNGRYGPYIQYKGNNYKLPKTLQTEPAALTYQQCMDIVNEQGVKEEAPKRKRTTAAKAATSTTKKAPATKKATTAKKATGTAAKKSTAKKTTTAKKATTKKEA